MNEPRCQVGERGGADVLFPMTPKTRRFRFGEVCADCDAAAERNHRTHDFSYLADGGDARCYGCDVRPSSRYSYRSCPQGSVV